MPGADKLSPPSPTDRGHRIAATQEPHRWLLRRIDGLGIPYGREDSFKMAPQRLIQDRVLIGIRTSIIAVETVVKIAFDLGMPAEGEGLLSEYFSQANAVFFGIEDRVEGSVCKVYLELWDQVRRRVRQTGAKTPLLLHFGLKWDITRPDHLDIARYTCHPLLTVRDVLRRMALVYPIDRSCRTSEVALAIVRQGVKRNPAASLLYLEVRESDNPRCSFDVNLYKTGLRISDIAPELCQAAERFGIPANVMDGQLQRLGPCPLGHLSGGTDRSGGEFLSVYGEIRPL